jgi:hypothetical protein
MEECVKLSGGKSIWNRMFDHTDNRLLKDFLKSLDPRQQDDWLVRNSAIEKPCLVEVKEYDPELVSLGCTILDYKEVNSNG